MGKITALFISALRLVQGVAGSFAAFKLSIYAIGYMKKNPQKIEEAKDGMKNVAIGLAIVILAETIINVLKSAIQ